MCIFQLLPTLSKKVKWRIQEVRGLTNRVPNKRPLYRAGKWESVLQGIHPSTSNFISCPIPPCEINTDKRQDRGGQYILCYNDAVIYDDTLQALNVEKFVAKTLIITVRILLKKSRNMSTERVEGEMKLYKNVSACLLCCQ